jgi:hypothetical protein
MTPIKECNEQTARVCHFIKELSEVATSTGNTTASAEIDFMLKAYGDRVHDLEEMYTIIALLHGVAVSLTGVLSKHEGKGHIVSGAVDALKLVAKSMVVHTGE